MKAHAIPMLAVATYIERMRRSLVSRITAFAIATVVGFASPALALTHGYAHHEHQEHHEHPEPEGGHGDAIVLEASNELHHGLPGAIQPAFESKDHAHPQLAHALPARLSAPLFVLAAIPATVPASIVFVGTAPVLPASAPARADPVDALPRQPRAPPLG